MGNKKPGEIEVYNDFNHNLVNLFRCMRDRHMAFIKKFGYKYLHEELELTKIILPDLKAEEIIELYIKMKQDYDLRRACIRF